MSLPRLVAQIAVIGVQVLGKAVYQASRQAMRNAQAGQAAEGSAVGRSSSNPLTLRHKMGLDEALNILNVKAAAEKPLEETALQEMLKNYEHLFKVNGKTSHYLQSKVVRAKARIEAERGSAPVTPAAPEASSSAPGPPPPTL